MWKTQPIKIDEKQQKVGTINVLYLEDDEIDIQALERYIEKEKLQYHLTPVSSVEDAKKVLQSQSFDVVLIDYKLPDGIGFDLLPYINNKTSTIFITGIAIEEISKAIKSGASAYVIKDPERNYLKVLPVTIEEVIKKKNLETEKINLEEELKRSNEDLQHLAYLASHDLQEPLRMISSYAQLLEKRYSEKLDKDAKEFIGFMVDGVNNMKALINDLLEYSRVESKKKEFEEIDCNEIIKDLLNTIAIKVNQSNSKIKYDNLVKIQGDKLQIAQLFQNLITNSIKYKSKSPPEIYISSSVRNDKWLFSVKDNGIGIAKEHQERIFKMFQRLHTKSEYEGTGIGLSICKKIVERHGGKIWVESEEEKGSTFYFTIPQFVFTGGLEDEQ